MIVIICILATLVVILGFTTFNLLKKNEKQEDILAGYLTYLDNLSRTIEKSSMNLILEKQTKVPPQSKVSKNYFTQETEDAIVLYNSTS
jgi:type II secretory pathway pseudopilin PulG